MEIIECFFGLAILPVLIGGVFGLGYWVIAPLGEINRTRVKTARFQLLDLIWLLVLLQPSLAVFGFITRRGFDGDAFQWISIFLLIWGGIIAGWYGMTGALAKAGVTHVGRRAAAVLLILPMIGVVIPLAIVAQFGIIAILHEGLHPDTRVETIAACVAGELAFVAALFGCRWLSRWIASGISREVPPA